MCDFRTAERVRIVSDSEVFVTLVILYSENSKINIFERHKIIKIWRRLEKLSKEESKKYSIRVYSRDPFIEIYKLVFMHSRYKHF